MARKTMAGRHGPGPDPDRMIAGRHVMWRDIGHHEGRGVGKEHGTDNGTNKMK
ncbi:hypothetical protein KQH49_10580 [Mycetohabitans sp. B5]|nr:hypothetical protein [Mycetohabitans sp. B5]